MHFTRSFAAAGILFVSLSSVAQELKTDSINSTGNDYLASLAPNRIVYFVSDRSNVDHGSITVLGCGSFKKPYSIFKSQNGKSAPVRERGTERWAGPPVFSADGQWMALPMWNNQCVNGVAGIQLVVYQNAPDAKKPDLLLDGTQWDVLRTVGQPTYKTAWHPAFHPTKPLLYFETEGSTGPAQIRRIPLAAGEPEPETVELPGQTDAVYPTFVDGVLHYSRPVDQKGLDLFSWDGTQEQPVAALNTDGNDFHWIPISDTQTWVSSRTSDRGTDVISHPRKATAAPTPAPVAAVETPKPKEAPQKAEPVAPAATAVAAAPQAPATPTKSSRPQDHWIAAGKFTNPDNAEKRAQALAADPRLASTVSVRFDGTAYSVVVSPPKDARAEETLAWVQALAPDAALKTTPGRSAKSMELEIYFDFDQSAIRPGEALRIKAFLAQIDGQKGSFNLIGHCDSRGSNAYNLQLGLRRAKSTKAFVEGLRGALVSTESSRSEWDLQDPCPDGVPCDENQHQRNRRVVLVFEPELP
jgi:outer membrane protein OmpA-like peptidoglycan-associated protein